MSIELKPYGKTNRLNSMSVTISEKLDGTNGCIVIQGDDFAIQSRNRFLDRHNDNFGFANWCLDNQETLMQLGEGYHYGEWVGPGIQKNPMGLEEKQFYLFNTSRPAESIPSLVKQVPILHQGQFLGVDHVMFVLEDLTKVRDYKPEGVIVYFHDFRTCMKFTADGNQPKWKAKHIDREIA